MAARLGQLVRGFKNCVVAKGTFLDLDTALFVRIVDHSGLTFGRGFGGCRRCWAAGACRKKGSWCQSKGRDKCGAHH